MTGLTGKQETALTPGLYVVATPIGNLSDISRRAEEILKHATVVACEDTRVSAKLMHAIGSKAPLVAYHDHNAPRVRPGLLQQIAEGAAIALISDAGTPMISDPGYKLVAEALESGLTVTSIPGASALLTALTTAGMPSDRFLFAGFAPPKSVARRHYLMDQSSAGSTLVFYESARRLPEFLSDAATVLGQRPAAVCRELTKKYEEVRRGTLDALAKYYSKSGPPKGEVVVVISPPLPGNQEDIPPKAHAALVRALKDLSVKSAARLVADLTDIPKNTLYELALNLEREKEAAP